MQQNNADVHIQLTALAQQNLLQTIQDEALAGIRLTIVSSACGGVSVDLGFMTYTPVQDSVLTVSDIPFFIPPYVVGHLRSVAIDWDLEESAYLVHVLDGPEMTGCST